MLSGLTGPTYFPGAFRGVHGLSLVFVVEISRLSSFDEEYHTVGAFCVCVCVAACRLRSVCSSV